MADEQAQAPAEASKKKPGTKVARLQKWGPSLTEAIRRLRKINLSALEDETGVFLKGSVLARALDFDNEVFAAYIAQRQRLHDARRPVTVEAMVALPDGGELCSRIMGLWFVSRKLPERELMCRVPPGDKALPVYVAFLNEATALLLKREYLGKGPVPKAPRYSAVGVGVESIDVTSAVGHSESLKAAHAARAGQKA